MEETAKGERAGSLSPSAGVEEVAGAEVAGDFLLGGQLLGTSTGMGRMGFVSKESSSVPLSSYGSGSGYKIKQKRNE